MENNPNLSRLSLISFVICFSLTANLFGQPETLWKTKFKKNVNWLRLAPTGHLIVSTGEGLLGVDPFDQPAVEDGKEMARRYLAKMAVGAG